MPTSRTRSAGLARTIHIAPASSSQIRVQGLPLVQQTAAGGDTVLQNPNGFSVALARDGTVWTWGSDIFGQLGHPDPKNQVYYPAPGELLSIGHIVTISAGANHVLALRKNGRLWAWGDDSYGEVGDGAYCGYHLCARFSPVRVSAIPATRMVSAGGNDSAAVDTQGRLWTWGDNSKGQLGTGMLCSTAGFGCASNEPAMINGLTAVSEVAVASGVAGYDGHMLAVLSDHRLYAWGDDAQGELGNPISPGDSATPVYVPGLANEAASIRPATGSAS